MTWKICILAGGLSRRMGRDKSRLKLGQRTMLNQIRTEAKSLGVPVRVIRRDVVSRCGPLGGVFTALKSARADAVLFLACDMPWVSVELIGWVMKRFGPRTCALFVRAQDAVGFPFALRRELLPVVHEQIARKEFSLHALAAVLKAKVATPPARFRKESRNVNTPAEWADTRREWTGRNV